MQSHVEFVETVICSEEMAVRYLRERNLLDNPEEAVINCDKCGSVMQNKRRLIRGISVPVMRCPRKGPLCASPPLCDIQLVWQYMCVALTVKHNYFIG